MLIKDIFNICIYIEVFLYIFVYNNLFRDTFLQDLGPLTDNNL